MDLGEGGVNGELGVGVVFVIVRVAVEALLVHEILVEAGEDLLEVGSVADDAVAAHFQLIEAVVHTAVLAHGETQDVGCLVRGVVGSNDFVADFLWHPAEGIGDGAFVSHGATEIGGLALSRDLLDFASVDLSEDEERGSRSGGVVGFLDELLENLVDVEVVVIFRLLHCCFLLCGPLSSVTGSNGGG